MEAASGFFRDRGVFRCGEEPSVMEAGPRSVELVRLGIEGLLGALVGGDAEVDELLVFASLDSTFFQRMAH
jgi:hypothetical protein